MKQIYVRVNQAPFMNKNINKEIMKRSRLRDKFLNTKRDIDRKTYNKQRNHCVSLIRRKRKSSLIILVHVTSQIIKHFGRQYKQNLRYKQGTNKVQRKSKITLIEKKLFQEKNKSK